MPLHSFLLFVGFFKSLAPADIFPGRNTLVRGFFGIFRYEPYLAGSLSSLDPAGVAVQTKQSRSNIPFFCRLGQCQISFQLSHPLNKKTLQGQSAMFFDHTYERQLADIGNTCVSFSPL